VNRPLFESRASGILLHVTSLPSAFGVGDLGPAAERFLEFLAANGLSVWQILPLNPTEAVYQESPYHGASAFAGNPLLISPERLVEDGLLAAADLDGRPDFPEGTFAAAEARRFKETLLGRAYENFRADGGAFEEFCGAQAYWLEDYALFEAVKARLGGAWDRWPAGLARRDRGALAEARRDLADAVRRAKFEQFVFSRQWTALKRRAGALGVRIMGDMPIYVDYASADVWAHPGLFKLDAGMRPAAVAGVPPDYFSATGQLWGNPVYDWDRARATGYEWWLRRVGHNLALFDAVRIDHFRGLVAYWEVAAGEKTALNGRWVEAPADDFFGRLRERVGAPALVAEDLGIITDDVREVMARFGFPGMRVLLFAFGPDFATHPYNPANYPRNCAAYTGTHDNNTARGWFEEEATEEQKRILFEFIGREVRAEEVPGELIRKLLASAAETVIIPMQDVLGLGAEARMNTPSTVSGNWRWRLGSGQSILINIKYMDF
jgi:4-alpha-glucanotransferase